MVESAGGLRTGTPMRGDGVGGGFKSSLAWPWLEGIVMAIVMLKVR